MERKTSMTVGSHSKSIAVLPFVNMSADQENEYFSDGITEEIINALTRVEGLKVIARTSSFAFKCKNLDVRTIGSQLGVRTILEGSVRKAANKVRITAQLINTDDGAHFWSHNFDRDLEDIFALQDEISLLIADQIRENFGHLVIGERLVNAPDIDIDSYEVYLKAIYFLKKFNVDDIKKGISLLESVVTQNPNFALARVNIHYGYNIMAAGGLMPVGEALSIGKRHLDQAMILDDNLPECYHSLGWHSLNQDWDFAQATKHLLKAIQLRPGYADAHQKLFINLALEGNLDMAYEHIQIAWQLDPLATLNNYFFGYYFYLKEEFDQSNHYLERALELEPSFIVAYSIYGLSLLLQDRPDYILEKAATIPEMDGGAIERLIMQTMAYTKSGDETNRDKSILSLRKALNGPSRERVRFFLIYIETIQENYEAALDLIDDGVKNREPLMTLLKVDPILRKLHHFDRFQLAIQKIYKLSDFAIPRVVENPQLVVDDPEIEAVLKHLKLMMEEDEIYLDVSISLRSLAQSLNVNPNKLSYILNEHIGKNFNEYINSFRLENFKEIALNPGNKHLTLLGMAFDSGFNSKTVFNSFFKKKEGVTPSVWLKQNRVK